jgi:CRP/FNR family cyclic AMP-dependent transcriptional regulator
LGGWKIHAAIQIERRLFRGNTSQRLKVPHQKERTVMIDARSDKPIDSAAFLSSVGLGRRVVELEPEETFFAQGDPADSIFCLQSGRAKLNVISESGKQATLAILSPGDLFGEESLRTESGLRLATATAMNKCNAFKIKREEMIAVMHREHEFCDQFLSYLLARSVRTQADLVDQIFNSSEKRLARMLLLMAEKGKPGESHTMIPPITQETLAEMIGTTRSRVSFFMNRFRDLGLVTYKDRIQVNTPRLRAALLDQFAA